MKNVLMKFAGLWVERVTVDEHGNPVPAPTPAPKSALQTDASAQTAPQPHPGAQPTVVPGGMASPAQHAPVQMPGAHAPGAPAGATIAIALRAWVPQEYAAHLAPFGLHVIAAGGSVTSEQARGWGATALVVSAECLGQDVHLLQQPQLPTVFITPQPVMIPEVAGVVQVQEPLRASDVAQAVRDASAAFATARR